MFSLWSTAALTEEEERLRAGGGGHAKRPWRALWLALGFVLVGIGLVGLFVPLLPTADFLILALPCFARSSPRLEAWLLRHPRFGPGLRAWRSRRAVSAHGKIAACVGMASGFALFWFFAHPTPGLAILVGIALAACAAWVVRRPRARV
ncbi:YbaN family protein [Stakelama tenebrarum]|uniref:DUF454 domain-containing protein n=1 Tax=Stakelama tenebrarum TaxID=2711215 RepID=A0A6G6Y2C0_9SPHN|nr:YbaN family protein [Sphingosinithalassobacter tenebrarum]QIG79072.1 DUF454 domain-containing protein [Sphingosinithalassobacter tenebrarum]